MALRTPASSSDRPTGRIGEPVASRRSPASSAGPGTISVACIVDGKLQETEGDDAIRHLKTWLKRPEASVWVDLAGPSPSQVEEVGKVLGLHPLIVEDVLEGNQRAKIETTDGLVHIVLFALDRGEHVRRNEIDLVLGTGYLLTVHDGAWDPRHSHHLRDGLEGDHGSRAGPPALGDQRRHRRWLFPVRRSARRRDRCGAGCGHRQGDPGRRSSELFSLKRELIEVRRAASPTREVFNQLTNRDLAADRPRTSSSTSATSTTT